MTATDISTIASVVAPVARRHGVERVYLFGSRARGDNRPDSDYDFLIFKGEVSTLWKFSGLWLDLEDALHSSVDVITEGCPDEELLEEARKDAVLLYEQEG